MVLPLQETEFDSTDVWKNICSAADSEVFLYSSGGGGRLFTDCISVNKIYLPPPRRCVPPPEYITDYLGVHLQQMKHMFTYHTGFKITLLVA